jgi:hypothetical protein
MVGAPAPRDVTRTAPGRDGVIEDTRYLTDRIIVLEGELWGASQRAVLDDWATLNSAFESTMLGQGQLTVTLPAASGGSTRQQWCNVTLASPAQVSLEGGSAYLSYQVSLRARDPRWFGMTQNTSALVINATGTSSMTSSSATLTNAGTAPSAPRFTYTFSGANYPVVQSIDVTVPSAYTTLSPQGSTISLVGASGANPLQFANNGYVDCLTRTTSGTAALSASTEWPVLYPGSSTWSWTVLANGTVTYTATASWYDAWW